MEQRETPVLSNHIVRLEPLALVHSEDLARAVSVGALWRTWCSHIPSPEQMPDTISSRLAMRRAGRMAPRAVIDARSGRGVGMTTYCNLDPVNRRSFVGNASALV